MKIVVMSDQHGVLPRIPKCDLLLLAGDLFPNKYGPRNPHFDSLFQLDFVKEKFQHWLNSLKCDVVAVAGNHDFIFDYNKGLLSDVELKWTYLQDSFCVVRGLKIWGSPYSLNFCNWAFNAPEEDGEAFLKKKYDTIPEDTDIIISHGPAYGFGDLTSDHIRAGSHELLKAVERIKPRFLLSGHIHHHQQLCKFKHGKTKIINASILDDNYEYVNKIQFFKIK